MLRLSAGSIQGNEGLPFTQGSSSCLYSSVRRMRQERRRFLNLKKIVIRLQAHIRKHQQLQKYKKIKKAAIIIQTHFRASVSARKAQASYQKIWSSVIVLQSAYRRMRARKMFSHTLASVIKIQSYYRAYVSRKNFQNLRKAAVKLQSVVRMRQACKRYLHLRATALFIQQWYRSQKMTVRKRREYMQTRVSCIKLQAYFRGYLVWKQMRLQNRAAISLQSYFRMRNRAASVIQRAVRHFLLRRRQEKINNSATRIQVSSSLVLAQGYNLSYSFSWYIRSIHYLLSFFNDSVIPVC